MDKSRIQVIKYIGFILVCILLIWVWNQYEKEEDHIIGMPEEYDVSMMVQESRYTLGLERMIRKIFVEEKIRINVQVIPDDQADSIIRMKVNTGAVPDILAYNLPAAYGLIKPELYLENLTNELWVPSLKKSYYKGNAVANIYGLPFQDNLGLGGIIYNQEIFDHYHIEIPTTEEEFQAVCEELSAYDITPVLMCSDVRIPQMWMDYTIPLALGGDKASTDMVEKVLSGEAVVEDYPEIATVIESYLSLFENQWVNADYLKVGYEEILEQFVSGDGAMIMGDFATVGDIKLLDASVHVGMYGVPFAYNTENEMVTPSSSYGMVIFQEAKNKEIAKKVLERWATPEYMELWFMDQGGISALEGIGTEPIDMELHKQYLSYVEEHGYIYEWNSYLLPLYNLNSSKMWLYYMEAPEMDITGEELLQQFSEDVTSYLNR